MLEYVRPMKARSFKDGKDEWLWDSEDVVMEFKHRGHRIEAIHGMQYSAEGHDKGIIYLRDIVPEGCMLDGEIKIGGGFDIEEKENLTSHYIATDQSVLIFAVFDILYYNNESVMMLPLRKRREMAMEVVDKIGNERVIFAGGLGSAKAGNRKKIFQDIVDNGNEGVVFKKLDAPYRPGSRAFMIKKKGTIDYDVVIVDCEGVPTQWTVKPDEFGKDGVYYPDGKMTDAWRLGYKNLRYGYYDKSGKLRVVGSLGITGPEDELKKYIGKVARVKSFGKRFETGALCHPQLQGWRDPDDKAATSCVFDFKD